MALEELVGINPDVQVKDSQTVLILQTNHKIVFPPNFNPIRMKNVINLQISRYNKDRTGDKKLCTV